MGAWVDEYERMSLGLSLQEASRQGDTVLCRKLLGQGADPRWTPRGSGTTALMAAASGKSLECVELLLPVSDPEAADITGFTAYLRSLSYCAPEAISRLLAPKITERSPRTFAGETPLMIASAAHNLPGMRVAMERSDPNGRDNYGQTAMMLAAQSGHTEGVRLLLPVSDLSMKDQNGRLASAFAKERGWIELSEELLAHELAQEMGQRIPLGRAAGHSKMRM